MLEFLKGIEMKNLGFRLEYPKIRKWEVSLDTTIGYSKYEQGYPEGFSIIYITFIVLGFGFYITWESK